MKKDMVTNVTVSIISGFLILILSLASRVLFWNRFGQEFFGIFTFVHSIIALVTIFGFGLNGMFKMMMHKPIVKNDEKGLIAIHSAFRKFNHILTIVICVAALIMVFFIPLFAQDFEITSYIYVIYFTLLFKIIFDRLAEPKNALIETHLKGYKLDTIATLIYVLTLVLKILMIHFMPNIIYYAVIILLGSITHYIVVSIIVRRNYKHIITKKGKLSGKQIKTLRKRIKRKLLIAVTASLATSLSNIIVGLQFGIASLAILTTYELLLRKVTTLGLSFITPLNPAVIRHCIKSNNKEKEEAFLLMYLYSVLITTIFMLGYFAIISDVIRILFNDVDAQIITNLLLMLMVFRTFIMTNKRVLATFMARSGLVIHRQFILMISGIIQSSLLVILPIIFNIYGIMMAPILTIIIFHFILEGLILYKKGFKLNPIRFYGLNLLLLSGFVSTLLLLNLLMVSIENPWMSLLVNGGIALGIGISFVLTVLVIKKSFRKRFIFIIKDYLSSSKMEKKELEIETAPVELIT